MRPDLRPRGLVRVIDRAFELYRANFKTVALSAAIVLFPVALLMGLAQVFYYRGAFELIMQAFSDSAQTGSTEPFTSPGQFYGLTLSSALLQLVTPLQWAARVYMAAAIYKAGPRMLLGERVTVGEFLKPGFTRVLWVGLITFVVSIVVNVGLLFLIVPGVILAAGLSVAQAVAVVEEVSLPEAFRRSWKLTQKNRWRIIGFWMLIATLAVVLQTAIQSPALVRQLIASVNDPYSVFQPVSPIWKVIEGAVSALALALIYPFQVFGWFSMYLDLRARREGMDIVARTQDITKEHP